MLTLIEMIEKTLGCTIPSLEAMAEFEAAMAAEERKEKEVSAKKVSKYCFLKCID